MSDFEAPWAAAEGHPVGSTALACLAVIGRQLGCDLSDADLAQYGTDGVDGASTDRILACARGAGLQGKAMRLTLDELLAAPPPLPAIARFKDGSSMVLRALQREGSLPAVELQDPNAGEDTPLVLDRIRFEQAWTGDLILVRRRVAAGERGRFGWPLVRAIARRETALLRDLALGSIGLSALALAPILIVQLLAQRVLLYRTSSTLAILCLALGAIIATETVLGAVRRFLLTRLAARTDARLATTLFDRLLSMPLPARERFPRGALTHRIEALGRLRAAVTGDLLGTALDAGVLVFFLPVMAFLSPAITVAVVLGLIVIGAGVAFALPRVDALVGAVLAAEEQRAAFQTQTIMGAKTIKSLGLPGGQRRRWRQLSGEVARRRLDLAGLAGRIDGLAILAERVLLSGSLALGVYLSVMDGRIAAVGTLVAFYLLVQRLLARVPAVARLLGHGTALRRAMAFLGAVVDQPGSDRRPAPSARGAIRGEVTFAGVSFRYPGTTRLALRDVSFACPAGSILGIMGPNGSGKSTVTRLLTRLQADYRGTIAIDGLDIRDIDPVLLRRSVSLVEQNSVVFSGTIRENLTAARSEASFEEMSAAAKLAGADEFIDRLPRGYETVIAEGAPTLSIGQRQRLALARTLLARPRILILDEALSALDGEIETRVLANLRAMAGERTVIIVSHRLASLMAADTVLVLDDGAVRDTGRHGELMERSELYSGQWHRERAAPEGETPNERLLALS